MKNGKQRWSKTKSERKRARTLDPIHGSNNVINIPHQIIIKKKRAKTKTMFVEVPMMLMLNQ